jgi:hypothetical protein
MKYKIYFEDFQDFVLSKDSWPFYLLIIGISFLFCQQGFHEFVAASTGVSLTQMGFVVDPTLAKSIVGSSVSYIGQIFAISFVIIGFLINNLKRYGEETYDMIYRQIRLFPILYVSLTLIGMLIMFSLFQDGFRPRTFANIAIWGSFGILVVITLIGYLFRKIVYQIKPRFVYEFYFKEIQKASIRIEANYQVSRNISKYNQIQRSLENRFLTACQNGDEENLSYILEVYDRILTAKFR